MLMGPIYIKANVKFFDEFTEESFLKYIRHLK